MKVILSIILGKIGCLYRQEMDWICHFIDNHPNIIMLSKRCWQPHCKVHINYLSLPLHKFYNLSQTYRPLVLFFHLLAIRPFATNCAISFFMPFHQHVSLKSRYILVETGWMEYLELWASSRILSWSSSTLNTYNLLGTSFYHLILVQKPILFAYEHLTSSHGKWGLGIVFISPVRLVIISPISNHYSLFCGIHKSDTQTC